MNKEFVTNRANLTPITSPEVVCSSATLEYGQSDPLNHPLKAEMQPPLSCCSEGLPALRGLTGGEFNQLPVLSESTIAIDLLW